MTKIEEESVSLWQIEDESHKPIKLSKDEPYQEFQFPIKETGQYALVFFSPDHLPKHSVDILIQVFTGIPEGEKVVELADCVPDPSNPENLQEFFFEYSNFYHSEVIRLSDDFPVLATQWTFPEEAEQ